MTESSPQRQRFESDGASLASTAVEDQAPALSSFGALARFEFEAGRGNEGTKILMVEWNDEEESSKNLGNWEVSWGEKSTVVSQQDGAEGKTHRLYFLIGPGAQIPPIVKIAQVDGKTMQTNPLPAIFPAELGASARTAGKKGVLHTIWGKQRLSVLQREIDNEMATNGEGVGLDMATQEKEWIIDNFGIGVGKGPTPLQESLDSVQPTSPKTPGGGRLAEKLRGLKLGTTIGDLNGRPPVSQIASDAAHPLSPDTGDVAVSSFSLFHGDTLRPGPRAVALNPPTEILAQQAESGGNNRMNSLNAVAGGTYAAALPKDEADNDDDLFAVMMSPRSPEMTKSPFSFSVQETVPMTKENEK